MEACAVIVAPSSAYSDSALGRIDTANNEDAVMSQDEGSRWIKLPEALFSSIMSVDPQFNPQYQASKVLSDDWLQKVMKMDEETATVWRRLDISYMSAICAPHADLETLKLMNDWNGWVFAFDDPFDEGDYTSNHMKATEEVLWSLSILDNVHPIISAEDHPIRHVLQSCWLRFQQRASPALQYRWKQYLTLYCLGVLEQVDFQQRATRPTVDEYMNLRARCVGALPCIGLMEYAEGIDLPRHVVEDVSLQAITRITCDLVTLQNDVFSYRKDLIKGEDSNIIFIFKDQGLTDQEAVERIGEMLYDCYNKWRDAVANVPSWGDEIDEEVKKFIGGCQNLALGNLHWSFYTPRYLGTDGEQVKQTRMIKLP
ncbi:hypothetical protein JX266_012727 [Neoarthrinium moseri]|nr:hypothetical protein JX266_012727 [Neoarthrinium moseri]